MRHMQETPACRNPPDLVQMSFRRAARDYTNQVGACSGGTTLAIQELLGEIPTARFVSEHYGKLPFARAGGCAHLAALGSWPTIERLLAQPDADLLIARQG